MGWGFVLFAGTERRVEGANSGTDFSSFSRRRALWVGVGGGDRTSAILKTWWHLRWV